MLSIEQIRTDTDAVRAALIRRAEDDDCLDEILKFDARRRAAITEGDELRGRRNQVSREIGQARSQGGSPSETVVAEMREVGQHINALEDEVRDLDARISDAMMALPNLPDASTPDGLDEACNQVLRHWGEPASLDFDAVPHWDLAERLGIIDFQRGVKLSGSRFYTLNGYGARLERAIISWMLDLHGGEHGYTEVALPILVRREIMEGSGNLPLFADNLYHDEEDDLWLIPTAEVPVTNLHRDEILSSEELPLYYVAHTPCFRREKAAAGRDTRGSSGCINSTKWRCTSSSSLIRRSTSLNRCWATLKRFVNAWDFPIVSCSCAQATFPSRPQSRMTLRCGPPALKNGWRSHPAPIAPTSRPVAPTSAIVPAWVNVLASFTR